MTMAITISTTFYEDFWANTLEPYGSTCWEWQGLRNPDNHYGLVHDAEGLRNFCLDPKLDRWAHRVAWALAHGPIPRGLWILHHCDNPPCVRPSHLFAGTRSDNMRDMLSKGRAWWQIPASRRRRQQTLLRRKSLAA